MEAYLRLLCRLMFVCAVVAVANAVTSCISPTGIPTATQSSTAIPRATSTVTPTITASATHTKTPAPTRTPAPTSTITPSPTPGPQLALWYLKDGVIYRYDLRDWKEHIAPVPSNNKVQKATLSQDGQRVAYNVNNEKIEIAETSSNSEVAMLSYVSYAAKGGLGSARLLFSQDGKWLTYRDDEGLKIANIASQSSWLYLVNNLGGYYTNNFDASLFTIYSPNSFSPNSGWLLMDVGRWEGGYPRLVSLATKTIYPIDNCMLSSSWSPDSQSLAGAVQDSAYLGCGEAEGIYMISVIDGEVNQRRIYYEQSSQELPYDDIGPHSIRWSPQGDWITFVQDNRLPESKGEWSRLMLISPNGSSVQELASVQPGQINSPLWAKDGKTIYFSRRSENTSGIYSIDIESLAQKLISSASRYAVLLSLSPDGNWLVFSQREYPGNEEGDLQLLNLSNGAIISLAKFGETSFLGWERPN